MWIEHEHSVYPPSLTQFSSLLGSLVGRRKPQLKSRAGPTNRQLQTGRQRQRQLPRELHNNIHKISNDVWPGKNTIVGRTTQPKSWQKVKKVLINPLHELSRVFSTFVCFFVLSYSSGRLFLNLLVESSGDYCRRDWGSDLHAGTTASQHNCWTNRNKLNRKFVLGCKVENVQVVDKRKKQEKLSQKIA